jgi:hypothetical protein
MHYVTVVVPVECCNSVGETGYLSEYSVPPVSEAAN